MHQVSSALLSFLLSPFNWLFILIIASFVVRRPSFKKSYRVLALCIFLLFSNAALLNWYAKNWQPRPVTLKTGSAYSCGIVPGGFASPDKNEGGHFNATADRFIQAVKLYKLGSISHILISGGNGKKEEKDFREGAWVKEELKIMGIPDSVIYTEDRSNNTFDNAVFAKRILDSMHLKPPYLLITSAHHVPRAFLLFRNAGINTVPYPCNYIAGTDNLNIVSFLPNPETLLGWNIYLKETAAYLWYYSRGN